MAAQLYQIQGRYDLALAIFLHQQQPAVFDFIQEHHLLPVLHERVAQLLSIDEERAVALLIQEYDQIPASTVVSSIQVTGTLHACCALYWHTLDLCKGLWRVKLCLLCSSFVALHVMHVVPDNRCLWLAAKMSL